MSDQSVFDLLRSNQQLVVIEAPAGCGKTFQGASYAFDIAPTLGQGRMLILTHTNAACDVFSERTKGLTGSKIEVKTIDALIFQIAAAYHRSLELPSDPTLWAYANHDGFAKVGSKISTLLVRSPVIATALARRYPIIVCDEHQDASPDHHSIIMSLHKHGSKLRIFGDRMQSIYENGAKKSLQHRVRWESLLDQAAFEQLDTPHRWGVNVEGSPELGKWVLAARSTLLANQRIDLTADLPPTVQVIFANNGARARSGYQVKQSERALIDLRVKSQGQIFILASSNDLVQSLRSFWGRSVPIWEGHTRNALSELVAKVQNVAGDAREVGRCLVKFMSEVGVGFTEASHGRCLVFEIDCRCIRAHAGKPGNIQALARLILEEPNHKGLAKAVMKMDEFIKSEAAGFTEIKIDLKREFWDIQRLANFADPSKGFAEISMRRTFSRPKPFSKSLATVHKAKGLECENVMVMHCNKSNFGDTIYGRCKLYVAISRAKSHLTLVIPRDDPSPLFQI